MNGQSDAAAWRAIGWTPLERRPHGKHDYTTRFKMLYPATGMYVLFDGSDQQLSATLHQDFTHLSTEDVFECFFWTDEK